MKKFVWWKLAGDNKTVGDINKTEMKTLYSVNICLSDEARGKRDEFQKYVQEMSSSLKQNGTGFECIGLKEVCYELTMKDSEGCEMVWQIVQRFGFEDPSLIPEAVLRAYRDGSLGLLPRGGVAHLKSCKNGTMGDRSRIFCFLPLPIHTELPVHINGHFALSHESRQGLWFDTNSSYMVQWNDVSHGERHCSSVLHAHLCHAG